MVNLFDYLRRRAYESIVAGLQDALHDVDRTPPNNSSANSAKSGSTTAANNSPAITSLVPLKSLPAPDHPAPTTNEEPPLPPRRLRGRPRREEGK